MTRQFTAIIEREDYMYVAHGQELDIATQDFSFEEANTNLREAIELFFESASGSEISSRIYANASN